MPVTVLARLALRQPLIAQDVILQQGICRVTNACAEMGTFKMAGYVLHVMSLVALAY